jgi:hypothetical protein
MVCKSRLLALTFAAWLGTGSVVHAYIDPGSGALIWQLLLAGFFGFAVLSAGSEVGWAIEKRRLKTTVLAGKSNL